MINQYVDKILIDCKITEFLEGRGINPVRKSGDKLIYHCPIHAGDNDPSFVVYPIGASGRDYQTYYCFGCHSGINIINLKSDLDKIPIIDSIRSFLKNVDIDEKTIMESIIGDIKKGTLVVEDEKELERLLLLINMSCRQHLTICEDEEEVEFIESFFKKVDELAMSKNIDVLEKVYDILGDGLKKRAYKFKDRQEERELAPLAWKI